MHRYFVGHVRRLQLDSRIPCVKPGERDVEEVAARVSARTGSSVKVRPTNTRKLRKRLIDEGFKEPRASVWDRTSGPDKRSDSNSNHLNGRPIDTRLVNSESGSQMQAVAEANPNSKCRPAGFEPALSASRRVSLPLEYAAN